MKSVEEKETDRFSFLRKMYEKKTRSGIQVLNTYEIATEVGFNRNEAELIVDYLEGEGLLTTHNDGWEMISITHFGILEVEQALSSPNEPTAHFPPVVNFIQVEQMHNSQIMQSSTGNLQTLLSSGHDLAKLGKFVEIIESRFSELDFQSIDEQNEALAEIQTIKTQISSPKPKEIVIRESGKTLRNILEGMTGSLLASELLKLLIGG